MKKRFFRKSPSGQQRFDSFGRFLSVVRNALARASGRCMLLLLFLAVFSASLMQLYFRKQKSLTEVPTSATHSPVPPSLLNGLNPGAQVQVRDLPQSSLSESNNQNAPGNTERDDANSKSTVVAPSGAVHSGEGSYVARTTLLKAAPSSKEYQAQVRGDTHNTPASLLEFAEHYVQRRNLVREGVIKVSDFCEELVQCVGSETVATPARVYCLEHFDELEQEFRSLGVAQVEEVQVCYARFKEKISNELAGSQSLQQISKAAKGFQ